MDEKLDIKGIVVDTLTRYFSVILFTSSHEEVRPGLINDRKYLDTKEGAELMISEIKKCIDEAISKCK